jgi:hypothetical protein
MTWREVWAMRLRRHWLAAAAPADQMLDVVGGVCGIHAQVTASAELSLGLRVAGLNRQDIRDALWKDRILVKTYGLRGTLHIFPTRELPLWLAALKAKPAPREPNRIELETLAPERRKAVIEAIREALDCQILTREQLGREIEQRVGTWATEEVFPAFGGNWPRWQLALGPAAADGIVAFGPNRGNRVTYVRLDQWVGQPGSVDGGAALREACRRYLAAYGPATHVEFARWFATPPKAALDILHSLGDELEQVDVDGWRAWLPANATPLTAGDSVRRVHLLPHFDCYVVGSHPREQLIPHSAPDALQGGTAAPFAVVLVDGVVGGLWERRKRGKVLQIRVDPFCQLDAQQERDLEAEATRVGEILETEVEFSFGHVESRGHM